MVVAVQDPPEPQQPPPQSPVQKILKAAAAGEAAKVAVGATVVAPAVTVTLPAQAAVAIAKVPVGIAVGGLKFAVALRVLRALFRRHHAQSADWLTKQLTSRYPNVDPAVIREAVARELQYEIAFQQKALARVQDDLNAAAKLADDKQQARINAILKREQHYSKLRQQAMMARATTFIENAVVKQGSPDGAKWMLGPAKNHTAGCVALAGKNWPWSVLDAIQPPLHTGCGCWLKPLGRKDTVPEPGEALRAARAALALEEAIRAVADPGEIAAWLSGLEVRPSVARALCQLQEMTVYDEILHPRGRGGEWIKKLGIAHIISIDGPAASGKSTVARRLAEQLDGTYIDTGAHYRAAGLAKTRGIDPVTALRAGRIRAEGSKVTLDGKDISQAIRTPEVDRAASQLGGDQNVRSAVDSAVQQRVAEGGLFVADGRDAGNALNAHDRIFLTASPQARAQRRAHARGLTVPEAHAAITERDTLDAPRIQAARAGASHVIDNSGETSDETVQHIINAVSTSSSPQPAVLPDDWPERGLAWQARWDALPDDTPVWVFHSTDQQTAEQFLTNGIDPVNKPTNLNRQRYEAGDMEGVFFQPGAGLAAGLPVALRPGQTGGYGRQLLAVKVRKGDIQVSPEQAALGETQPGGALRVGDAVTSAVIAPQDVVAVGQPGRDPSAVDITGQLRERGLLQEAFDESLHPRDRYGKWSFLGRLHTLSRSEIEGGHVPGVQVAGLAAGVAGNAGLGGRPITLAPSSFGKEGLVSSVLVAHEAGHHLTSTVIKDGKIPDELKAFDVGPGRPAGRYGAVAGNVSHLFANPWKGGDRDLPEEMIADGYADLLHGGAEFRYDGPPEPEPGTDEHKAWTADVAKDRAAFESNPKFKLLGVIAKAAREHGMPDKALYRFESSKVGNDWHYKLALRESDFTEALHPRDRTGKWMAKLGLSHLREVGGAPRDELLGKIPKDIDYVAMETPERIQAAVEQAGGTAMPLMVRDRLVGVRATHPDLPDGGVEIVPPRVEASTGTGRHDFEIVPHPGLDGSKTPEQMLGDDAQRRDFTVNALYRDPETGEITDPTGHGDQDARQHVLRMVHDQSFQEDPLRMLRGARFASQHNLTPEPQTLAAMTRDSPGMTALTQKGVSGTVQEELRKLLMGDSPGKGLRLMRDTGMFQTLLPELAPMVGFDQRSVYHSHTLDEHTFSVIDELARSGASYEARLAALFHDSGKPLTASPKAKDPEHFHFHSHPVHGDHQDVGADIARRTLGRLNYPRDTINHVADLVSEHMLPAVEKPTPVKARRLRAQHSDRFLNDLLDHKAADMEGHGTHVAKSLQGVAELRQLLADNADAPRSLKDLKVNGSDLIDDGHTPGPKLGQILHQLLAETVVNPKLNDREWLLNRAQNLAALKTEEWVALDESVFDAVLHPRGRRGQWIDAIDHYAKEHEPTQHTGFTGEDFAAAMDGFEHAGIVAVRSGRTQTQNQYGQVWLNLQKVGEIEPVGLARVTIKPPNNRGERHAELSNIYLRGNEQNNGFGAAFTNHFLDTLRANGVDKADVEAVSVGGYAWARRGFVWTGDKGAVQRQILADAQKDGRWQQIADQANPAVLDELERKLTAGEFTSEAELAAYGLDNWWFETPPERHDYTTGTTPPKTRNWPGKELMIGSHWKGELDLHQP